MGTRYIRVSSLPKSRAVRREIIAFQISYRRATTFRSTSQVSQIRPLAGCHLLPASHDDRWNTNIVQFLDDFKSNYLHELDLRSNEREKIRKI